MGHSSFDTCFYERYAREVLARYEGPRYGELLSLDRPDLQMADGSLGIEVTRAMNESAIDAALMLDSLMGGRPDVDSVQQCHLGILDSLSCEEQNLALRSGYAYGLGDGSVMGAKDYQYWSLAQPLRRILSSKIQKVDSGFYGDFASYGLFVFCRFSLSEVEVDAIYRHIRDTQWCHSRVYESVWLALSDRLYTCRFSSEALSPTVQMISRADSREFFRCACSIG